MKNICRVIFALLVPLTLLLAQAQTAKGVGYGLTKDAAIEQAKRDACLLYTSPSPRDATLSRMPSSA